MSRLARLTLPAISEALFATVSYRLEPDGRGTRFPTVMNSLDAGRLDSKDAGAALIELEHIEAGLRDLPLDRVVWSATDLRRIDDSQLPVNHSAANAYEYFVDADGRPLLAHVRESIERNMSAGRSMTFRPEDHRDYSRVRLFGLGLAALSAGIIYYGWYVLSTERRVDPRMAIFAPVCLIGGIYVALFPRYGGRPETTAQLVLALVVFGIGLVAGLFNLYLMDPSFSWLS